MSFAGTWMIWLCILNSVPLPLCILNAPFFNDFFCFQNIKLSSIKVDTRYTTTQQVVKLIGSHTISKVTVKIGDLKRTKMVRTINLYYNNRTVQAIVELKNKYVSAGEAYLFFLSFLLLAFMLVNRQILRHKVLSILNIFLGLLVGTKPRKFSWLQDKQKWKLTSHCPLLHPTWWLSSLIFMRTTRHPQKPCSVHAAVPLCQLILGCVATAVRTCISATSAGELQVYSADVRKSRKITENNFF